MLQIVEFFTKSRTTKVTVFYENIQEDYDENLIYSFKKFEDLRDEFFMNTLPCNKSISLPDIRKIFSDEKLSNMGKNGILFLATDEESAYGSKFYNFKYKGNVTKIKVGANEIYKSEKVTISPEIMRKIETVFSKVKSDMGDVVLLNTIGSIKKSYRTTGIIAKEDLQWLNKIYKRF